MTISKSGDVWTIGNHKLAVMDAKDSSTYQQLFSNTIPQLVFTSPPYDQQRTYQNRYAIAGYKLDWTYLMKMTFDGIPTNDQTQIIVNLGLVHRNKNIDWYWKKWTDHMKNNGWNEYALYIWDKLSSIPVNDGRLGHCFEFLFHFNKTIRHPNKTKPKQPQSIAINTRKSSLRKANGEMSRVCLPLASLNTHKKPDALIRVTPNKHNRKNQYGIHPATFPIKLPKEIIETFTHSNDIVLDPFMGSGTTIIAAHELNRTAYGVEIEPAYADLAIDRIERSTGLSAMRQDGESFAYLSTHTESPT